MCYTSYCKGENRNGVAAEVELSFSTRERRRMGLGRFFVSTQELLVGPCSGRLRISMITSVCRASHSLSTAEKGAQISQSMFFYLCSVSSILQ